MASGVEPYANTRAALRRPNRMRCRSRQQPGYPELGEERNIGRVHTRSIAVSQSRARVRWNRRTALPPTITLAGSPLLTLADAFTQTVEETLGVASTTHGVWYNVRGRVELRVPLGNEVVSGALARAALEAGPADQVATIARAVGAPDSHGGGVLPGRSAPERRGIDTDRADRRVRWPGVSA
jgi:hypothetical protein